MTERNGESVDTTGTAQQEPTGTGSRTVAERIRGAGTAPIRLVRRRFEHRPRQVLAGLTVAVTVCAVLAGGFWTLALVDAASRSARTDAVDAAARTTTALLSYDPQSVDGVVERVGGELTPEFRADYGVLISQVVAPATAEQQVTTEAQVVGSALVPEESRGDRVVALLFVNQTTRAAEDGAPRVAGSRVEVTMNNVDSRWLVAGITPV
ncbi:hypothetical protein [Pseudonocardia parietis]|uniref:Mce-associated membrane protein n=1 Tax=Pseudonocardia parietis TaxID=570936 RepID=A0ABS4VLK4_9PSEU|nr:hypothetical protein [Pseudonocardia parietis]MBP2364806.1 Mce-associated membrane protein [Pseudonocardia parietis]